MKRNKPFSFPSFPIFTDSQFDTSVFFLSPSSNFSSSSTLLRSGFSLMPSNFQSHNFLQTPKFQGVLECSQVGNGMELNEIIGPGNNKRFMLNFYRSFLMLFRFRRYHLGNCLLYFPNDVDKLAWFLEDSIHGSSGGGE